MLQQEAIYSKFYASQFEGTGLHIRRDFWFGSDGNCNTFLREYNAMLRLSSVLSQNGGCRGT